MLAPSFKIYTVGIEQIPFAVLALACSSVVIPTSVNTICSPWRSKNDVAAINVWRALDGQGRTSRDTPLEQPAVV
eukprot:5354022-Amphidinium_carterae.3